MTLFSVSNSNRKVVSRGLDDPALGDIYGSIVKKDPSEDPVFEFVQANPKDIPATPKTDPDEETVDEPDQSLSPRNLLLWPRPLHCVGRSFVVVVHTRTDDFHRRKEWRETYGNLTQKYNFDMMFVIGRATNKSHVETIVDESRLHGDILQGDFVDTYRNITHKQLCHMRYVQANCSAVPWILKIDDDLTWNVRLVHQFAIAITPDSEFINNRFNASYGSKIWCYIWRNARIERKKSEKWAIPRSHLPSRVYPNFCSGIGYLMTHEAVAGILKAAETARWLWVDDAFVTGYLAASGGVSLVDMSMKFEMDRHRADRLFNQTAIFGLSYRPDSRKRFGIANRLS